jgi:hypothetical protein
LIGVVVVGGGDGGGLTARLGSDLVVVVRGVVVGEVGEGAMRAGVGVGLRVL